MKSVHDHLRDGLLQRAGLAEPPRAKLHGVTFADLRRSEWSDEFEHLMRNRLCMGALRYGRIGEPGKPVYNRLASIRRRLDSYEATGNKETLVDAANLLLMEFAECRHPLAHFTAADDTSEHVATA